MYVLIKISGARIVILFELYSFIFSPAVRCADRILLITRQIIFEKKKTKKKDRKYEQIEKSKLFSCNNHELNNNSSKWNTTYLILNIERM